MELFCDDEEEAARTVKIEQNKFSKFPPRPTKSKYYERIGGVCGAKKYQLWAVIR
jgi:hypothetical protein